MNPSEVTDGAEHELADGVEHQKRPTTEDRPVTGHEATDTSLAGPGAVCLTAPGAQRPPTGDQAVDEVLGQLDSAVYEPLDIQIAVGERVHQVLKERLADLGQE